MINHTSSIMAIDWPQVMMAEKDHRCTEPNHRAKLLRYDAKLRCKVKKREAKRRSYAAKSRSSNKTAS